MSRTVWLICQTHEGAQQLARMVEAGQIPDLYANEGVAQAALTDYGFMGTRYSVFEVELIDAKACIVTQRKRALDTITSSR